MSLAFLPAAGGLTNIHLALLVPILAQIPSSRPAPSTTPAYLEFFELHAHILYPLLAVLVLVLLVAGILQAWRSQDLDGLAKAELKREIILEMRRQVGGVSAEALAKNLGLEPLKLVRLLEEMQKDGIVGCHTNTHRLTVWQVAGMGQTAPRR